MVFTRRSHLELFRILWFLAAVLGAASPEEYKKN